MGVAYSHTDIMTSCTCKESRISKTDNSHCTKTTLISTEDTTAKLVRESWKHIVPKIDQYGVDIFLRIFQVRPDVIKIFPFRHKKGDELLADLHFQMHARRFMKAIGTMVDHMESPELVLYPILIKLGEIHVSTTGEFFDSYLDIFLGSVLYVWKKNLGSAYFNTEMEQAWKEIFLIMVDKLREGHSEKLAELKSKTTKTNEGSV